MTYSSGLIKFLSQIYVRGQSASYRTTCSGLFFSSRPWAVSPFPLAGQPTPARVPSSPSLLAARQGMDLNGVYWEDFSVATYTGMLDRIGLPFFI